MKKRREDGWTFMETIIVIAIVLILTTTVGFTAIKNIGKARVVSAKTQIDSFVIALESFYIDCGKYPTQEQGLEALVVKPSDDFLSSKWNGPYLYKDIPMDPWGNPYEYVVQGYNEQPYSIRSFGADGYEGGQKDDEDITSWQ